jgi:hypothetical protein
VRQEKQAALPRGFFAELDPGKIAELCRLRAEASPSDGWKVAARSQQGKLFFAFVTKCEQIRFNVHVSAKHNWFVTPSSMNRYVRMPPKI